MSINSVNNSCIVINKNYPYLYKKNLVTGFIVGEAVICSETFINSPPIHERPFQNRASEIGLYNYFQDAFFSRIKTFNSSNTVDNFIFQGLLQGAKWFPNFLMQNYIKELIHHSGYKPGPFIKNTIVITPAMTLFFAIGATADKLVNEGCKWSFVITTLTTSAFIFSKNQMTAKTEDNQVIKLNLVSATWAGAGLIGSFAMSQAYHIINTNAGNLFNLDKINILKLSIVGAITVASGGSAVALVASTVGALLLVDPLVEYASLKQGDFFGYNKINLLSLSSLAIAGAGSLDQEKASAAGGKIVAFTIAKANGVVGVEMAWDIKDYVCSFPAAENICNFLGLIDHTIEQS